jgi:hypothetical protein
MTTLVLITAGREGWDETLCRWNGPKVVIFHGCGSEQIPGATCIWYDGPFNHGELLNLAMSQVRTIGAWVIHDDVAASGETGRMLASMSVQANAVLAFPNVSGPDGSWQQRVEATSWSDAVSYCSSSAFWVTKPWYPGIPFDMPGKSFIGPFLQLQARKDGRRAIVVHPASVTHRFGGTWDSNVARETSRTMLREAAMFTASRFQIRVDGWGRLSEPCPVRHDDGTPIATVDEGLIRIGPVRIYKGDKPDAWHFANASPSDTWIYRGETSRRYRVGDGYRVCGEPGRLTITVQPNIGLGDVVFVAKAIRAIGEAWPGVEIHGTSQGGYGRLLAWCSDLKSWHGAPATPESALEIGHLGNWGADYVPDHLCRHFGVEYRGQQARFEIPKGDLQSAETLLERAGYDGRPLLAIVPQGGWIAKRWVRFREFVLQAQNRGYAVWTPGRSDVPGTLAIDTPDYMSAVALLPLCTAVVGFDSGLSHVAVALGCKTVVLSGPTDALGLALEGDAPNAVALEMRDPMQGHCGLNHCRKKDGGASCPLRMGLPGADCIDEIAPHHVWRALEDIIRHGQTAAPRS